MIDAPKRAVNRCTSSLSRGTGFGGASFAGGAGFGAAGAPAAAAGAAGFAAAGVPGAAAADAAGAAGFAASTAFAASGGLAASAGFAGSADAAGGTGAGSFDFGGVPPPSAPPDGGVVASFFVGSSAICFLESSFRIQASSAKRRASVSPVSIPARKFRARTPPVPSPKPGSVHSQSSAPFRNNQTYPTIKMPRKTSIVNSP